MKPVFLDLEQRSPEWHAWRANRLGGSDVGSVLGLNPWTSAMLLWERKTGRAPAQADNPAMARGRELEDEALAAWSKHTGEMAAPACVEHPEFEWAGASLDGITFDGQLLVEIKCMGQKNHQKVVDTLMVPEYYLCQCQYQLACAGADRLHFWAYRPEHEVPSVLIEVQRDDAYIAAMFAKLEVFWSCVQEDVPPADREYLAAEKAWMEVQGQAKSFAEQAKTLKAELVELIPEGQTKLQGLLTTASFVEKEGTVDWAKMAGTVIELAKEHGVPDEVRQALDPERYRRKGTEYWDVRPRKRG